MNVAARLSTAGRIGCALAAIALTLFLAGTAHAATTFTVNTPNDSAASPGSECMGGQGDCSIRQALDASSTGDTILIPPNDYKLTGGALSVNKGVTVKGTPIDSPATTIVDGQGNGGVFSVNAPGTTPVTIEGLTVTGGMEPNGGGIDALTPLTLVNDSVTGNTAEFNGGGIYAQIQPPGQPAGPPPLTVVSSLIAGNRVDPTTFTLAPVARASTDFLYAGGGLADLSGGASLTNTTVADNAVAGGTSESGGGGVYSSEESPLSMLNVTVNGNSVTGGTGSGGGGIAGAVAETAPKKDAIAIPSTAFTAQNTIVSHDTLALSGAAPTLQDCANLTTTPDHDISTDTSCGFTDSGSKQTTDPAYTSASPQDNGGPTHTLGINESSPAFNAGDSASAPNVDQRGVSRPQAGAWDIGAFEYVPSADLQITKAGTPATVALGHNLTYTLTVRNNGPDPATGVTVSDTLPASETLVSATPSQGACTSTTCTLGNLGSGASATITVVARANATGSVTNTASVHGNESDPDPANNTAAATNSVAAPQSLARPTVHASAAPCYRNAVALSVSITTKSALKGVRILLNGHLILTTKRKHFTIHISKLAKTHSTLTIIARNNGGKSPTKHITLRRCAIPKPRFTG